MRATASSLSRLRHCQWWARPEVLEPPPEPRGPESIRGTRIHQAIHEGIVALTGGVTPHATPAYDADVTACAQSAIEWLETTGQTVVDAEVPLAWHTVFGTGRILRRGGERDYRDAVPDELVGTADLVSVDQDGLWWVTDWKTGRPENVDAAESNLQLAMYALAIASVHKLTRVGVRLAYPGHHEVMIDEAVLDLSALGMLSAELVDLVDGIPTSTPKAGSHCRYCPIRTQCPAVRQALELATPATMAVQRRLPLLLDQIEDADHAAWAYEQARALQIAQKALWAALHAYVDAHGGIKLQSGKTYRRKPGVIRETIVLETPEAVATLRQALGDRFDAAVEATTSKAAITRATKGTMIRLPEVLDALRAVHAVRSKATADSYDES